VVGHEPSDQDTLVLRALPPAPAATLLEGLDNVSRWQRHIQSFAGAKLPPVTSS
jgi:hypothetical protein